MSEIPWTHSISFNLIDEIIAFEENHKYFAKPAYLATGLFAVVETIVRLFGAIITLPALMTREGRDWYVEYNGVGLFGSGIAVAAGFIRAFKGREEHVPLRDYQY